MFWEAGVYKDWEWPPFVGKDDTLFIGPGVTVEMENMNFFVMGTIYMLGSADSPITIRYKGVENSQGHIYMRPENGAYAYMQHVRLEDVAVYCHHRQLKMRYVHFSRERKVKADAPVLNFRFGSLFVENCTFRGNGEGEGLIIRDGEGLIRIAHNSFFHIPDAVEFISVDSGLILSNEFNGLDTKDDAIDLNDCEGVLIAGNKISGYDHCGIEIGHDNFAPCSDIDIRFNTISDCAIGVHVKDGSSARVLGSVFERLNRGLVVNETKEGWGGASLKIRLSRFQEMRKSVVYKDVHSTVDIGFCWGN